MGCEKKRDEGGLEISGASNGKVGGSVGEPHGSTVARLGLKHLLDKPPGYARCRLDMSLEEERNLEIVSIQSDLGSKCDLRGST